ncbi:hypothetical protein AB3N04_00275 (plasmid) [Alkalihalophilus sp. As8PL]|uniref:SLAP domain-containing protein n=1 Tax=Alkalihalophilus sp. As8PL TaxID=3237103 RepID=A0AB39BNY9_9BACI
MTYTIQEEELKVTQEYYPIIGEFVPLDSNETPLFTYAYHFDINNAKREYLRAGEELLFEYYIKRDNTNMLEIDFLIDNFTEETITNSIFFFIVNDLANLRTLKGKEWSKVIKVEAEAEANTNFELLLDIEGGHQREISVFTLNQNVPEGYYMQPRPVLARYIILNNVYSEPKQAPNNEEPNNLEITTAFQDASKNNVVVFNDNGEVNEDIPEITQLEIHGIDYPMDVNVTWFDTDGNFAVIFNEEKFEPNSIINIELPKVSLTSDVESYRQFIAFKNLSGEAILEEAFFPDRVSTSSEFIMEVPTKK